MESTHERDSASEAARAGAGAGRFAIGIKERLRPSWSSWFDGMTVRADVNGTVIEGTVRDYAALYGLLDRLRDLNLSLVYVRRYGAAPDEETE